MRHALSIISCLIFFNAFMPASNAEYDLTPFYNTLKTDNEEKIIQEMNSALFANMNSKDGICTFIDVYYLLKYGEKENNIKPNPELAEKVVALAKESEFAGKIFERFAMISENESDYLRFANMSEEMIESQLLFEQAKFKTSADAEKKFLSKYLNYPSAAYAMACRNISEKKYKEAVILLKKIKTQKHVANANIILAGLYMEGKGVEKSDEEAERLILEVSKKIRFGGGNLDNIYDSFSFFIPAENYPDVCFSQSTKYKILKFTLDNIPESRGALSGECLSLAKDLEVSQAEIYKILSYSEANLSPRNMSEVFGMQLSSKDYIKAQSTAKLMFECYPKPDISFMSLPLMYCAGVPAGKSAKDGIALLNKAIKSDDDTTKCFASILLAQMYWNGSNGLAKDRKLSVKLMTELNNYETVWSIRSVFFGWQNQRFIPKDLEFSAILGWFILMRSSSTTEEILYMIFNEINYESTISEKELDDAAQMYYAIEKFFLENKDKYPRAKLSLAELYNESRTLKDAKLHFKYLSGFCAEADKSDFLLTYAKLRLGCAYLEGFGTDEDLPMAYKIFTELSIQTDNDDNEKWSYYAAKELRAYCLSKGKGVATDTKLADTLRRELIKSNDKYIFEKFVYLYQCGSTNFYFPFSPEMSAYWKKYIIY